jgi:hypothetical protein
MLRDELSEQGTIALSVHPGLIAINVIETNMSEG